MIKIKKIACEIQATGIEITMPGGEDHPHMLIILCRRGFVMCGYLNMEAAAGLGDTAAIVSGADFDSMLNNPVKSATDRAVALGVAPGMTGRQAVDILNA